MRYPNIALSGKAQSGKDTAAAHLVEVHGYTRLALADPLKEMALEINPYIPTGYGVLARLARLVADVGWDYAKTTYPEVRRLLQHTGQTVREYDPEFWLRALYRQAEHVAGPIVVTDVRYRNELASLSRAGFTAVRIMRPGIVGMTHASETELDGLTFTAGVSNDGTVERLHAKIDGLLAALAD